MRYPYIAVIGDKEAMARTLSVRSRQEGELGALPLPMFAEKILAEATLRVCPRPQSQKAS